MSSTTWLVFPNTLFKDPHIPHALKHTISTIIIIEEPIFIYDKIYQSCRVNKNKIALLRAALKSYEDSLHNLKLTVKYIDYKTACTLPKSFFSSKYHAWDPTDANITKKYCNTTFHESPSFVLSLSELRSIDTVRLTPIYNAAKRKLRILEDTPSQDSANQRPPPKTGLHVPEAPKYINQKNQKFYDEAIKYANSNAFTKHVGDPTFLAYSPITHEDAARHLEYFIKQRFDNFGPYQDATLSSEMYMFHANISHLLNIGLLTPQQVVTRAIKEKRKVPLSSLEGFVRQVIGWREYMRYLYVQKYDVIMNPFKTGLQNVALDAKTWSPQGIPALDKEIVKARHSGYAHHIVRLMFFLNFMKLSEVPPAAIYKWFMEVVSLDAYPWVMYSNIAAMGYFTDPPMMQKPYLSTSAYIKRMSDYKHDIPAWDALFYSYLKRHKLNLKAGASVYLRNLATFERRTQQDQEETLAMARGYMH